MKLDLTSIRKLSPAGLWDLAELAALIVTVQKIVCLGIGSLVDVRRHTRMAAQYRRELAARKINNFNLQVKAWVLQCPERIAFVRGVIGEVAIKRWKRNRLLDYAFTKAFGDWKKAFPNGVRRKAKTPKQHAKYSYRGKIYGYNWKPFALVKIPNAERILFGQNRSTAAPGIECGQGQTSPCKLRGVAIADTFVGEKTPQPRKPRTIKPVRFTPHELAPETAADTPQNVPPDILEPQEKPNLTNGKAKPYSPPKQEPLPQGNTTSTPEYKPP